MSMCQASCILGKVRNLFAVFPPLRTFTDAIALWMKVGTT